MRKTMIIIRFVPAVMKASPDVSAAQPQTGKHSSFSDD